MMTRERRPCEAGGVLGVRPTLLDALLQQCRRQVAYACLHDRIRPFASKRQVPSSEAIDDDQVLLRARAALVEPLEGAVELPQLRDNRQLCSPWTCVRPVDRVDSPPSCFEAPAMRAQQRVERRGRDDAGRAVLVYLGAATVQPDVGRCGASLGPPHEAPQHATRHTVAHEEEAEAPLRIVTPQALR